MCKLWTANVLFFKCVLVAHRPTFLHLIFVAFFPCSSLKTKRRQLCDSGLDLQLPASPAAAGLCSVCPRFLWINHLVNEHSVISGVIFIRCRGPDACNCAPAVWLSPVHAQQAYNSCRPRPKMTQGAKLPTRETKEFAQKLLELQR